MKPRGYRVDGKKRYPLVVFLHGAGVPFTSMYCVNRCGRR
jgi:predicted peptidase